MDFMYDLRALALVVTGALPFAVGTQMTPDAPLLGAMIYYAGLAGAGTVSAAWQPAADTTNIVRGEVRNFFCSNAMSVWLSLLVSAAHGGKDRVSEFLLIAP